ncbi:acyltransferase family protein [Mangrovibacter yixingensis]|uniref:acyltransferase family protein n=1 Tax=Mangrovibacter yixingensis TaxID=1529639 RepID=UPI001CFAC2EA|nr:acyltransferase family protein [Mangrovibacter yixingensis]
MFRRDINGLRAIAVLLVVLFHFKFPYFDGGYIGVDIFFVISGYLMNEICAKMVGEKRWILAFYKKRINRVYPALLSTTIIATFITIAIFPPSLLSDLFGQVLSTLTFTSNIFYYNATTGYFSPNADSFLLLHTWSLGVEFQYYLIFPLALLIAHTKFFKKRSCLVYGAFFLTSLFLCLWYEKIDPSATFYFLPTRAWELFLGAFASSLIYKNPFPSLTQFLSISVIILFCVWSNYNDQWTGLSMLIPTLATAILLHARVNNEKTILRFDIAQYLGNASYSIYLVHWPLVALAYNLAYEPTISSKIGLSLLSILLGFASYYLVEKNCKKFDVKIFSTATLVIILCFICVEFQISKLWISPAKLAMDRYGRAYELTDDGRKQFGSKPYSCFYTGKPGQSYDIENCMRPSMQKKNILLLGDSHMADMSLSFKKLFSNYNIMQATLSSCLLIPGEAKREECKNLTDRVYKKIESVSNVDVIFISAYWSAVKDTSTLPENIANAVKQLKGKTNADIYIIGQTKVFDKELPSLIRVRGGTGINQYRNKSVDLVNNMLKESLPKYNVKYINIYDFGCDDNNECNFVSDKNYPMLFDTDHLTQDWAISIVQMIKKKIENNN